MFKLIAFCIVVLLLIVWFSGYNNGKNAYSVYGPGDAQRRAHVPIKRTLKPAV
jgi:hypothetical protein